MQKGKLLIGLFGLDANKEFHYTRYFFMFSAGPKPSQAFTEGYFQVAAQQKPSRKPSRLLPRTPNSRAMLEGARENAKTSRIHHRLRQELSARHDRLLADYSRADGCQC